MTPRKARSNILKVMAHATPEEIYEGSQWYADANATCRRIAANTGIPVVRIIYAMAALSPNVGWRSNIAAIATMAYAKGKYDGLKFPGYPENIKKAKRILDGGLEALKGPKVTSFANNILFPNESTAVTVDVHAYSVASGKRFTSKEMPTITPKIYKTISDAYARAGESFGLTPSQCQAICWVVWRRLNKSRKKKSK